MLLEGARPEFPPIGGKGPNGVSGTPDHETAIREREEPCLVSARHRGFRDDFSIEAKDAYLVASGDEQRRAEQPGRFNAGRARIERLAPSFLPIERESDNVVAVSSINNARVDVSQSEAIEGIGVCLSQGPTARWRLAGWPG
jgi:hypothetical protein